LHTDQKGFPSLCFQVTSKLLTGDKTGCFPIQDLAIRCIQKNIKKNRGVKGWPWWKLFTTVRPLIEVQLTEEQIRGKDEEIQQLKLKLEKVEKERNELRLNSDRLESKITELSSELADERNTGESASQLLESETSERLRLEKDMKDLQAKFDTMKKQMESMEMEVMEARLIRASELNGEMDDDDTGEFVMSLPGQSEFGIERILGSQ
ncbi:unconventional myosin-XVIIIa-like, partial [Sinocyclocheilus grahami]|uniref:unconventional myosin-XVIIIa-like n=1 Tax=Sinocyclocheilus grahami TaxID=75366 RepID=UPI0007AD6876